MPLILTSLLSFLLIATPAQADNSAKNIAEGSEAIALTTCAATTIGVFAANFIPVAGAGNVFDTIGDIHIRANDLNYGRLPINSRFTRLAKTLRYLYKNSDHMDKTLALTSGAIVGACVVSLSTMGAIHTKKILDNPRAAVDNDPAFRKLVDKVGLDEGVSTVKALNNGEDPDVIIERVLKRNYAQASPINSPQDEADTFISQ